MEIFLCDAASQLSALRDAVAVDDAAAVERIAHTLKGSAAMLGATSVARSCAELIQSARHRSLDGATEILAGLEGQVAAIEQTLTPRPTNDAIPGSVVGPGQ
jgi:HPt (histidine-containing phosphotransfer) domain-containing protein